MKKITYNNAYLPIIICSSIFNIFLLFTYIQNIINGDFLSAFVICVNFNLLSLILLFFSIKENNKVLIINKDEERITFKKQTISFSDFDNIKQKGNKIIFRKDNINILTINKDFLENNCYSVNNIIDFFELDKEKTERNYDLNLITPDQKKVKIKNIGSIIASVVIMIGYIISGFMLIQIPEFPIEKIYFWKYGLFWITLCFIIIFITLLILSKKYFGIKFYTFVVLLISFPFILGTLVFSIPEKYCVSSTSDINNYNLVDVPNYFPEEINNKMEVINFYYYYKSYHDYIVEYYLEIKIEDDEYFNNIYQSYDNIKDSETNSNYEEYIIYQHEYLSINEESSQSYIQSASIGKILFNKHENIIIYVELSVSDIYYVDDCMYYKKLILGNE